MGGRVPDDKHSKARAFISRNKRLVLLLQHIKKDLDSGWKAIIKLKWGDLSREEFAAQITRLFPPLWQAHPFHEGNTRTIVMLMTFFVEHYGYYFDKELLAASAGYVRNAFVMASLGQYSEYEHLEKILLDAICTNIEDTSNEEFLLKLLKIELTQREITRKIRLLKTAGFDVLKTFQDYSFAYIEIPKSITLETLKTSGFIQSKENQSGI